MYRPERTRTRVEIQQAVSVVHLSVVAVAAAAARFEAAEGLWVDGRGGADCVCE